MGIKGFIRLFSLPFIYIEILYILECKKHFQWLIKDSIHIHVCMYTCMHTDIHTYNCIQCSYAH